MPSRRKLIREAVQASHWTTAQRLAAYLDVPVPSVRRGLRHLEARGLVEADRWPGAATQWRSTEDP